MKNQKRIFTKLLLCALIGMVAACNNSDDDFDQLAQLNKEIAAIDQYIANHNLQAIKDPYSGVSMVITLVGEGPLPAHIASTVDIDYKGYLFPDGAVFEEDHTRQTLSNLIDGWKLAFSHLPEGSHATLYIPSFFGYGRRTDIPEIPANSTLTFDVRFNEISHSTSYLQKLASDTIAIRDYLADRSLTATRDITGVKYVITQQGTGPSPGWYDKLKIKYTIKLLSNDTQSVITLDREPSEFFNSRPVDYVQGMLVGLQKMNAGSKATLYLPSGLGFGTEGGYDGSNQQIVPPNANLIIELELKEIVQ